LTPPAPSGKIKASPLSGGDASAPGPPGPEEGSAARGVFCDARQVGNAPAESEFSMYRRQGRRNGMAEEWKNKLYFGDNLDVMRKYIPDESVDLIYLDPPFNSKATYNVLFQEKNGTAPAAQVKAFEDFWHWDAGAEKTYHEVVTQGPKKLADLLRALMEFLGRNDMMAYLTMMAVRLVEMHRVLKPTGSIYLHCDPTASHYIKLLMDAVFSPANFRNEIVWRRTTSHSDARRCGNVHDILFFYSKTDQYTWNRTYQAYDPRYVEQYYRYKDKDGRRFMSADLSGAGAGPPRVFGDRGLISPPRGRHWIYDQEGIDRLLKENRIFWTRNGVPRLKVYLDEAPGMALQDVWDDIQALRSWHQERLGYQTQKPEALLERIIRASSNEGDLVLDPFCGCGTTVSVAERLKRRWIGIDITHLAIALIKHRLEDTFGEDLAPYEVIGVPQDLKSAEALAEQDRFQFQYWALSLVDARPVGEKKKGPDEGIDGYIYFFDDASGKPKKVIVSVKSGHVTVSQIRDLKGVLEREKAEIGAFITLREPTEPMRKEALAAGFYEPEIFGGKQKYPRIQILTIKELLEEGKRLEMPRLAPPDTFKKAPRKEKAKTEQLRMG